jgi:hypothetical protein
MRYHHGKGGGIDVYGELAPAITCCAPSGAAAAAAAALLCLQYLQHDFMEAQLQELQQQPGPTSPDNMATDAPDQHQQHQQQQQHPSGSQGQGQVTPGTTTPPAQQQSGPAAAAAAASPSSPLWHNLPGTPGPGCGLTNNSDVLACRADWLFYQGRFEDAYQLTSVLLAQDPYATQALTTHLAAALQLGKKNELFLRCEVLAVC